jgi:hypothetical protein
MKKLITILTLLVFVTYRTIQSIRWLGIERKVYMKKPRVTTINQTDVNISYEGNTDTYTQLLVYRFFDLILVAVLVAIIFT